jgi:predicted aspartyl protease
VVADASYAIAADRGAATCKVERQAELALIGDARPMLVAAEINGSPVTMIVDTAAQWTSITPETVKRLNLPPDPWHGGLHSGVATFSSNVNAVTRSFKIGGVEIDGRSLSVVPLPPGIADLPQFAGLLGADFLYRFDLDLDLPHRALTLYRNDGCRVGIPPWGGPVLALPLVKSATNRLTTAVTIDGHPFHAILDTGATASLISRPNALRAGVSAEMLDQDPALPSHGLGTRDFMTRRHVFGVMQVGPERFDRVSLLVSGAMLGGGDMLLGLDYLGRRRVWLSYALRQMFVAAPDVGPNGSEK